MGLFALCQIGLAGDACWIWIMEYANAKFKIGVKNRINYALSPMMLRGLLHF